MGGGLLQLVAYGAQDVYLTGNPQITFFKVVYRRHTNFALESIQQTFNGTVGYGSRVTSTIARNGDLISRAYLVIKSTAKNLCPYFGLRVIKHAEVEIGGQKMDKHYADWMYIWNELSLPVSKKEGYFKMVGGAGSTGDYGVKTGTTFVLKQGDVNVTQLENANENTKGVIVKAKSNSSNGFGLELEIKVSNTGVLSVTVDKKGANYKNVDTTFTINVKDLFTKKDKNENITINTDGPAISDELAFTLIHSDFEVLDGADKKELNTLYVPLEFWFCRNIGLALPLIALQYHEVKFKIEFAEKDEIALMWNNGGTALSGGVLETTAKDKIGNLVCNIYVDYIFLDTDERRKFAQLSHEYLIEQLQFTGEEQFNQQIRLNFNHPVKELVWVSKWSGTGQQQDNNPLRNYYNYSDVSNIEVGGGNPFTQASIKLNGNDRIAAREGRYFDLVQPYQHHTNIPKNGGINVYSFALKPEEHQPSGTLNMSRIDSAHLHLKTNVANSNRTVLIYAINYNVLRILSGMGGLAYSN